MLKPRLLDALRRFNPEVPGDYLQQALAEIVEPRSDDPISENHRIHDWLVGGFRAITYTDDDGQEQTPTIRLLAANADDNNWLVASQVTMRRGEFHRRFDLVLYCNGMPVSIVELKRAGSLAADLPAAHAQLQTYLREFPMAFRFAVLTVVSDGITARYGTPFTELHHFARWNVDEDGAEVASGSPGADGAAVTGLELLLHGVFEQKTFLELLRWYTAFAAVDSGLGKRIAKPHQYFAADRAVGSTVEAVRSDGKARCLAHPGLRQVDGDGAVHQPDHAGAGAGEPDGRAHHRPHRARRSAVRCLRRQPAATGEAEADPPPQGAARGAVEPDHRRHLLHHAAEVRQEQR